MDASATFESNNSGRPMYNPCDSRSSGCIWEEYLEIMCSRRFLCHCAAGDKFDDDGDDDCGDDCGDDGEEEICFVGREGDRDADIEEEFAEETFEEENVPS